MVDFVAKIKYEEVLVEMIHIIVYMTMPTKRPNTRSTQFMVDVVGTIKMRRLYSMNNPKLVVGVVGSIKHEKNCIL